MLVEEIMKTDVITCPNDKPLYYALQVMKEHKIRHLPIINENEELVGMIAERNIKDALPEKIERTSVEIFFSKPVTEFMVSDVITAHRLDFVEDLAAILYERKIGCIPIVENKRVIGIVTETDMLYTLVQLTGANQASSIIEVHVENKAGTLANVAQIIGEENINITSVLLYPNDELKRLVIRMQTMDPTVVIQKLKDSGYYVPWPSIPGITE